MKSKAKRAFAAISAIHPDIFDLKNPKPLAEGFHDDLAAEFPEIDTKTIRSILGWWVNRRPYLLACIPGARRYTFGGVSRGLVMPPQALYAAKVFSDRNGKAKPSDRYHTNHMAAE